MLFQKFKILTVIEEKNIPEFNFICHCNMDYVTIEISMVWKFFSSFKPAKSTIGWTSKQIFKQIGSVRWLSWDSSVGRILPSEEWSSNLWKFSFAIWLSNLSLLE